MCAACGVPAHVAVLDPAESPGTGQPAKFAALRNPECKRYLGGAALAMMADNIEHIITTSWDKVAVGNHGAAHGDTAWQGNER